MVYKCVKIIFEALAQKNFLPDVIQKKARQLAIQGHAQIETSGTVKIIAYGTKDAIELFIDTIYKDAEQYGATDIEVEPFSKDRDFRGVFRIIE